MTQRRQIGYWLRNGLAFAAMSVVGGCSLWPSSKASPPPAPPSYAQAPAPAPAAAPQPAPASAAILAEPTARSADASAPTVNVFGEFDGAQRHFTATPDDSGMQQHTVCEEGYDADVAIDPTGKWLAFTSTRHSENPDIYLQRVDGNSVIELTSDPASDVQPAFSADGKRIAFASNRSGNWDIYVMDADGRNIEQVTSGPAQEMRPTFSPDGKRLAYCCLSPRSDQWELWVVDMATRQRQMIGMGLFPSWSPQKDVDRIAFQRPRQRGSRWFSVWTIDLVSGEPTRPTEVAVSANAAVVCPSWSPDGKRLCFSTIIEPERSPAAGGRAKHDIWTCAADGGGARQRLTRGDAMNLSPVWGVDNRVYFISDRSGHENVWSIRAGGSPVYTAGAAETGRTAQKEQKAAATSGAPAGLGPVGSTDMREPGHRNLGPPTCGPAVIPAAGYAARGAELSGFTEEARHAMRSIQLSLALALLLGLIGCTESKPDYGFEQPLYLPGRIAQKWAVAPAVDLSGQRPVDPVLQADLLYQQAQQIAGLTVIPVNRVVEVYSALRIDRVQSEEQAALVCDMLGCDGLLVATVTIYDPYEPPKMGAGLTLFRRASVARRATDVDPRELARRATPPPSATLPSRVGFIQAVGMFDAANGSVRADVMQYAAGRNDPAGAYRERSYLVDMDRYTGFVYHRLLQGLLARMAGQ